MGIFDDTVQKVRTFLGVDETDEDYVDYEVDATSQPVTEQPAMRLAATSVPAPAAPVEPMRRSKKAPAETEENNLHRLNSRQKELASHDNNREKRTTIDIKFPKRYEDAPEIVNLLLENASVLIDFQYMTENQARRCLDYLDGARSVLAGNLKKVSSTMWLLTPVNVTVNIEELRSAHGSVYDESSHYDFDMRR